MHESVHVNRHIFTIAAAQTERAEFRDSLTEPVGNVLTCKHSIQHGQRAPSHKRKPR
jgi:hypothetical protein